MNTIQLPHDFKEFIQLLNSEKVDYLLVGGYAVGFHGNPRFTNDMDIWIGPGSDNAVRLGRVLSRFGFNDPDIISGRFLMADTVFRMGHPPLQIDLLSEVSGCDFSACHARRSTLSQDGIEISVISIEDLKANKLAAGRAKDLGDLEGLA